VTITTPGACRGRYLSWAMSGSPSLQPWPRRRQLRNAESERTRLRRLAAVVWIEHFGRRGYVRRPAQLRCPDRLALQPHALGFSFRLGIHGRPQPGEQRLEWIHEKHPTPAPLPLGRRLLANAHVYLQHGARRLDYAARRLFAERRNSRRADRTWLPGCRVGRPGPHQRAGAPVMQSCRLAVHIGTKHDGRIGTDEPRRADSSRRECPLRPWPLRPSRQRSLTDLACCGPGRLQRPRSRAFGSPPGPSRRVQAAAPRDTRYDRTQAGGPRCRHASVACPPFSAGSGFGGGRSP
jgi:hypothetical protein